MEIRGESILLPNVENASWNGSLFKAGYCRGMHAVKSDDGVSESSPALKRFRSNSKCYAGKKGKLSA